MRIYNDSITIASDLSLSANSQVLELEHMQMFSIQIAISGTALNGTFKLQASNDPGLPNSADESIRTAAVTHWTDIGVSSAVSALTGTSVILLDKVDCPWAWVRLVWTAGSGTGSITNCRINAKGI